MVKHPLHFVNIALVCCQYAEENSINKQKRPCCHVLDKFELLFVQSTCRIPVSQNGKKVIDNFGMSGILTFHLLSTLGKFLMSMSLSFHIYREGNNTYFILTMITLENIGKDLMQYPAHNK